MDKVLKSIPVKFAKYESINETVSKVKCYIQYANKNRNGSYMSKESIEKAITSLYGVPVVGEYKKSKEDFGDHGGKIIIDSDGIEYIQTTVPFGFVPLEPEFANVAWEEIEDEDGETREYLVADAYLWRKRYPEVETVFENGVNQSMEIDINEYEWSEELNAWDLKDFSYSALCLLGLDVEPAFESASVKSYSLNKEDFKTEFSLMMKEIKESFQIEEVKENEELIIEQPIVEEFEKELEEEIITIEENLDENVDTEQEKSKDDFSDKSERQFAKFELSFSDIENKIYNMINEIDEDGWMNYDYWICEMYPSHAVIRNYEEQKYYKLPYTINEDESVMIGEKIEVFSTWLTQEEKDSLESMQSEFTIMKEKEQLEIEAQLNIQKDEIFEKYDELLLENEEYIKIKESKSDYTIEMLETTLAVLYVKSNVQFSAKQSNKSSIIKLGNEDELNKKTKPVVDPYGGLFTKNN